jgi:hypothetical protein
VELVSLVVSDVCIVPWRLQRLLLVAAVEQGVGALPGALPGLVVLGRAC